ncbi:hypothetical protein EON68_00295 [archaeon]|nr:MAG: hypothetical protein EON68_00295 [archaeon]
MRREEGRSDEVRTARKSQSADDMQIDEAGVRVRVHSRWLQLPWSGGRHYQDDRPSSWAAVHARARVSTRACARADSGTKKGR